MSDKGVVRVRAAHDAGCIMVMDVPSNEDSADSHCDGEWDQRAKRLLKRRVAEARECKEWVGTARFL